MNLRLLMNQFKMPPNVDLVLQRTISLAACSPPSQSVAVRERQLKRSTTNNVGADAAQHPIPTAETE